MTEVIYLSVETVELFLTRALREHGGIDGLQSRELWNLPFSNHSRARSVKMPTRRSHPKLRPTVFSSRRTSHFGNKRTAAASMLTFLYLHRYALNQTDDEIYDAFIKLATGEMSKEAFSIGLSAVSLPMTSLCLKSSLAEFDAVTEALTKIASFKRGGEMLTLILRPDNLKAASEALNYIWQLGRRISAT